MSRSHWILAIVGGLALSALAPGLYGEPAAGDKQKAAELARQAREAYDRRDFTQSAELYGAAITAGGVAAPIPGAASEIGEAVSR